MPTKTASPQGRAAVLLPAIPQARGSDMKRISTPLPGALTALLVTLVTGERSAACPTSRQVRRPGPGAPAARTDRPDRRELRALRQELARQPDGSISPLRARPSLHRTWAGQGRSAFCRLRPGGFGKLVGADAEPPAEVLLMRATLRQRTHDFDAALLDLAILLHPAQSARRPGPPDARDDSAGAGQFRRRRLPSARRCAASHPRSSGRRVPTGWPASRADCARATTRSTRCSPGKPEAKPEVRAWVLSMLAEMAARAGLNDAAEAHFREALAIDPSDHYLLTAYADWLLDQRRASRS
jgi:tetratricopeptide (TPR) repeat protein